MREPSAIDTSARLVRQSFFEPDRPILVRETTVHERVTPVHSQRGHGILEPPPLAFRGQDDRCEDSLCVLASDHLRTKLAQDADYFF